jgi:hypothetical protein
MVTVQPDEKGFTPSLNDLCLDLSAFCLQNVPYGHLGALPGEKPGLRSTHSPCATAYKSNLALQLHTSPHYEILPVHGSLATSGRYRHSGDTFVQ